MRACAKCGCTEQRACLEFDDAGYAHACWWVTGVDDTCSACVPIHRTVLATMPRIPTTGPSRREGKNLRVHLRYLREPALAGMVARPRR